MKKITVFIIIVASFYLSFIFKKDREQKETRDYVHNEIKEHISDTIPRKDTIVIQINNNVDLKMLIDVIKKDSLNNKIIIMKSE